MGGFEVMNKEVTKDTVFIALCTKCQQNCSTKITPKDTNGSLEHLAGTIKSYEKVASRPYGLMISNVSNLMLSNSITL
jgi:hypothetical protein